MGPKIDVRYKELSSVKCTLHRGYYKSLTVISSVPEKKSPFGCREVYAIKDVRYKQVSLYNAFSVNETLHQMNLKLIHQS